MRVAVPLGSAAGSLSTSGLVDPVNRIVQPYDVPPQLVPWDEKFHVTNVVTYYGTDGDSWTVDPSKMRCNGETDFASVPRVGVWLVPKFGKVTAAAVLHDYFCSDGILNGEISPRQADHVFRSVMRRDGVPPLLRNIAWAGVRWGAVANPIRRHEWWLDFPRLLPISLVALPIMLLAAVGILVGLALYGVAEWLAWIISDEVPESDAGAKT